MEITCLQMDVLISFYIDGDLSETLKEKVEEHLRDCPTCRAKLNIISSLFADLRNANKCNKQEEVYSTNVHSTKQYKFFKNNLSAYIDNELPEEDSIKMKKYTIGNKTARKELENAFLIKKLMQNSFKKTEAETKPDFSKNIIKQLSVQEKNELKFNPVILVAFAFVVCVLFIGAVIMYILLSR